MKRKTEQRALIREVMGQTTRPLTANEVLDLAQEKRAGLGIATVYRTINGLVEEGWLLPVELPGEPARYERREMEHHHHFQCQACRKVFDVPGCSGLPTTGVPSGFEVARHEIVFYGRCAECVVNRVQVPDEEYRAGEVDLDGVSPSLKGHLASCSPDCGHDHGVKEGRPGAIAARKLVQVGTTVSVVGVEAVTRRKDA